MPGFQDDPWAGVLRTDSILVVNSGSCGEAESCQVAGSLPV